MKIVLFPYVRASTTKQEQSPDVQKSGLERYAEFIQAEIKPFYVDFAVSARKTPFEERPSGAKLWADIQALRKQNPNCEIGIAATKLDRIFRNSVDGILFEQKLRDLNVYLHFSDMGGVAFATKSATGRLMFRMMLSTAEFEAEITAERTTSGMTHRRSNGEATSHPQFGFERSNDPTDKKLYPHEREMKVVEMIFQMLGLNYSLTKIAAELNQHGILSKTGKQWSRNSVDSVIEYHTKRLGVTA
jgi:site-specific DNA recombinase